jgi:hypothetical protein
MRPRPASLLATLLATSSALLACGGSSHPLQSVTVSPATASGSQVQFTATGLYSTMPTSADITSTTMWCVGSTTGLCSADVAAIAEVTAGLAECASGVSGTVIVLAGQPANHPGMNQGYQLEPFGAAQLTCP